MVFVVGSSFSLILLEAAGGQTDPQKRLLKKGFVPNKIQTIIFFGLVRQWPFIKSLEDDRTSEELLKTPKTTSTSKFARVALQAKDQLEVEQLDEAPEIPREVGFFGCFFLLFLETKKL